ncbi:hypothetical protein [Hymenobacter psoromatis]|uniref:hypothetical protein n=1 Tax=Hymenobacter psoromatis TaxID=1484116 RepID=UPI001CBFF0D2|nr:hypothetical protein [Hymenobacter psoromatis]
MKATTRPARRIPTARLERVRAKAAAAAQAREAAFLARQDALVQLVSPTPEFQAVPRLTMLPGGLHWSGQGQAPQVGATVTVSREGHNQPAQVKAYCHAAGFLGLVVEVQQPVKRASRKPSPRAGCVFGSQLALVA